MKILLKIVISTVIVAFALLFIAAFSSMGIMVFQITLENIEDFRGNPSARNFSEAAITLLVGCSTFAVAVLVLIGAVRCLFCHKLVD